MIAAAMTAAHAMGEDVTTADAMTADATTTGVKDATETAKMTLARKNRAARENRGLDVVTSLISTRFTRMINSRAFLWNLDLSPYLCLNQNDSCARD